MDGKPTRRSHKLDHKKLIRHRRRRGWSQEDLAKKARRSTKTVQRAEDGEPVDFSTIKALADALEVVPADILFIDDSAIDRFFQAMIEARPRVALEEFSEGATLSTYVTSEEEFSQVGAASPEPGQFQGKAEIGKALEVICDRITVIDAEETVPRESVGENGVLVRGRVVHEDKATQKRTAYRFFLVFDLVDGRIDSLEMSYDSRKVAEGNQETAARGENAVQSNPAELGAAPDPARDSGSRSS